MAFELSNKMSRLTVEKPDHATTINNSTPVHLKNKRERVVLFRYDSSTNEIIQHDPLRHGVFTCVYFWSSSKRI
jgi:hypothetical protein